MSVPKYKALLIACITLFLCGCGQALSEREIVRAVFFARQQGQYSVCLLLADQNNNEDGLHYKTSSARGFTAAQALHRAETTLPGRLYYGLIDLAVLPADADWQTARELGSLLYDKAQPAPELSVFALDTAPHSWAEDAAALYEDMKSVRSEYRLHCGLQQLFTQADCCTVPSYRADSGYDLLLLAKQQPAPYRAAGLAAQLAAVLCGQTDRLYTTYAGGTALCRARIDVTVQDTTVQLHLRDTASAPSCSRLLPHSPLNDRPTFFTCSSGTPICTAPAARHRPRSLRFYGNKKMRPIPQNAGSGAADYCRVVGRVI